MGNTKIRQYENRPLPQTTTLPWSGLGYQSNGNYNGTWQQNNRTPWNNVPSAPPSYRTNSWTPSPTLPQSALGNQSNTIRQNWANGTQNSDTETQYTDFVDVNYIAKEVWLPLKFVGRQGMTTEKALIDCRANENCMDIKTAKRLGVKPLLLDSPIGLRNVDGSEN